MHKSTEIQFWTTERFWTGRLKPAQKGRFLPLSPKAANPDSPKLLSRWETRQETQPSLFKLDTGLVPFPMYITGRLHTYKQSLSKNIQCDDKFGLVSPTNC